MRQFIKTRKTLSILLVFLFIASTAYAAGIWNRGEHTIYSIWKFGTGSAIVLNSNMTFTGNNIIEASDIANLEKTFDLDLNSVFVVGVGVIGNDGSTAPGLAITDNIVKAVYASSAESAKMQWTFRRPSDYVSGLGFRVMLSSSAATSALQSIDWQLWINDDATVFDSGAVAQDAVAPTSATLSTKNELITLNIDSTGESAISAGSFISVDIWNAGTSDNTTEIIGVQAFYTAAS